MSRSRWSSLVTRAGGRLSHNMLEDSLLALLSSDANSTNGTISQLSGFISGKSIRIGVSSKPEIMCTVTPLPR